MLGRGGVWKGAIPPAFSLPSQTGNAGLFLNTNGTNPSWASPLPSQGGNSGLFLTTNGSASSWGVPPASGITYTPSGLLVSTTAQGALDELAKYANANPLNAEFMYDPMSWGNQSQTPSGQFGLVPSGVGGGGPLTPANFAGSLVNRFGVVPMGLGTTSNSTATSFIFSDGAIIYPGQFSSTTLLFGAYMPATLSDGTNTYVCDFGFRSSFANGDAANSMCFRYKSSVSANWICRTSNNSTVTETTTSTAVTAGAYWDFKLVIASGSVAFYAAPAGSAYTLLATNTTNLPDSTHTTFMTFIIFKAATFAVQRYFGLDYIAMFNQLSSQR